MATDRISDPKIITGNGDWNLFSGDNIASR